MLTAMLTAMRQHASHGAEFMHQRYEAPSKAQQDGFARMGQPIDFTVRAEAYKHVVEMGITDKATAMQCVERVAEQLENDEPYAAMAAGMRYLDLTGTYRLFAVLLTA